MKKLPKHYLIRQKRKEHALLKRKRKQRTHGKARPFARSKWVHAPGHLALTPKHAGKVIRFVHELERKAVVGKKMVIDFSRTKLITALSAVYLYSEIDRALMKKSVVRIHGRLNPQVRYALGITGILEKCGHSAPPDSSHIPVLRGEDDDHLPIIVNYLMGIALFQKQLITPEPDDAERLVNSAISEAMLNVKQHAYPRKGPNDFWWATATILENNLHIALCDRGVGIPKTLKEKGRFRAVLAKLKPGAGNAKMIKAAMEYTRSSREGGGSGLGSRDIQQLVLEAREGHLTIISGKGYYHLQGESEKQLTREMTDDVAGTLIQWQIPLHRQSEAHHERAYN